MFSERLTGYYAMSKWSIHRPSEEPVEPLDQKPQVSLHVIGQPHGVYTKNLEPVRRHV